MYLHHYGNLFRIVKKVCRSYELEFFITQKTTAVKFVELQMICLQLYRSTCIVFMIWDNSEDRDNFIGFSTLFVTFEVQMLKAFGSSSCETLHVWLSPLQTNW